MSSLYVCGDTHGRLFDTQKIFSKQWPEYKTLTSDDVLVQLGDFGWLWYPIGENKEQEYYLDLLSSAKHTLAVVPGNHDNYDLIFSLPKMKKWGGSVRYLERKKNRFGDSGIIYFLERGEIYNINGKVIWVMGGALSIDKDQRTIGVDYWHQEIPSFTEMNYGMEKLDSVNWTVDLVFTHTCPIHVYSSLLDITIQDSLKYKDPTSIYFSEIDRNIKFKQWHFGHFHKDVNDEKYFCHYLNKPYLIT